MPDVGARLWVKMGGLVMRQAFSLLLIVPIMRWGQPMTNLQSSPVLPRPVLMPGRREPQTAAYLPLPPPSPLESSPTRLTLLVPWVPPI